MSLVVGNKYMVGMGDDKKYRLSTKWGKVAFDLAIDSMVSKSLACSVFFNQFCAAMKLAEQWEKLQIKRFGIVATSFGPFNRMISHLQTETGRMQIMSCASSNVRLSDNPCGGGLPACVQIVAVILLNFDSLHPGPLLRAAI